MILNDSCYYPGLVCNTIIPVEMRGNNRHVAIFSELQERYGISQKDEFIKSYLNR